MGVLGRVDRDLPTGVGEGPPRSPTAEAAAAHRVRRPDSGEELQADIRGVAVGDHAAPVWTRRCLPGTEVGQSGHSPRHYVAGPDAIRLVDECQLAGAG